MLTYLNSLGKLAVAIFVGLLLILGGVTFYREHEARVDAERRAQISMQVNDSTTAQAALVVKQRNELKALQDAAKTMNGNLVAGVEIVVKPETVYVGMKAVPTTMQPDSTRLATVTDTTKGYTVTINAKAKPFPAPLELGYTLITPEFHPQVGFVQRDEGYYAVVSWAGQTFTPEHSFFTPDHVRPLGLYTGANIMGDPMAPASTGQPLAGNAYLSLKYAVPKGLSYSLSAGFNGKAFVGLGVEKRVW